MRSLLVLVLAAGEGTRMASSLPKVLHKVAGRSMVGHVVATARGAGAAAVAVVVGPGRDDVAKEVKSIAPEAEIFVQAERRGTAHAVLAARAALERGYDDVVVMYGDTPLVEGRTTRPRCARRWRTARRSPCSASGPRIRPAMAGC